MRATSSEPGGTSVAVPAPACVEVPGKTPFERFGWLLWGSWMIFLVFPAVDVMRADQPVGVRVVGLVLIGFFAVAFTRMTYLLATSPDRMSSLGAAAGGLAVLAMPLLGLVPFIGVAVVSLFPFVVSFGVFALPRPGVWYATAAFLAGTLALLLSPAGWVQLPFGFVILAVALACGAGRVMRDHGEDYARRSDELTVAAERERVARDVHDVLGHSLTVVAVKAELAARLIDRDPERARAEIHDVQRLSREALAEVRATVGGLRVARLDDEVAAARTALQGAGIEPSLPDDLQVLDPRHRPVAGWVLREAVTNVIRHSRARSCTVELAPAALVVCDDGIGIPAESAQGAGHGLRGVRERLRDSGGELRVGPGPDGIGTRLEVSW